MNCGAGCRYPFATDHGGNDGSSAVYTTNSSESYGRTDRGRLHSPDSGGNFLKPEELGKVVVSCVAVLVLTSCGMLSTWHRFCVLRPPVPKCPPAQSLLSPLTGRSQFFRISRICGLFQLGKVQNFPASFSSSELSAGVRKVFGGPPVYLAGAKDQSVSSTNGRGSCRTRTSFKLHFSVAPTL